MALALKMSPFQKTQEQTMPNIIHTRTVYGDDNTILFIIITIVVLQAIHNVSRESLLQKKLSRLGKIISII